jgi:formate dehydrogenase subunit gamma
MNIRMVTGDETSRIASIVSELAHIEGAMLPILHRVQQELGYIPDGAKQIIASALNLSRAEVHGVVTFYPDFRSEPAGRHVVKLCRAEACQAMGCDDLAARVKQELGIDWHQTTTDGQVTLEPVYCLGLCAQGPTAMIDEELYGRLNEHCLSDLLAEVRK